MQRGDRVARADEVIVLYTTSQQVGREDGEILPPRDSEEIAERAYRMRVDRKGVHFEKRESTSIKVNPELWKSAKIEAIKRGLTVSELVELAVKKELSGNG